MVRRREILGAALVLLGVLVTACGPTPSDVNSDSVPLAEPAGSLPSVPMRLVVLHTNDNWGEPEPCG